MDPGPGQVPVQGHLLGQVQGGLAHTTLIAIQQERPKIVQPSMEQPPAPMMRADNFLGPSL